MLDENKKENDIIDELKIDFEMLIRKLTQSGFKDIAEILKALLQIFLKEISEM